MQKYGIGYRQWKLKNVCVEPKNPYRPSSTLCFLYIKETRYFEKSVMHDVETNAEVLFNQAWNHSVTKRETKR